ncbi:MAG: cytochrome c1 [Alphaproteobacteria bacterium]|nr:cytochrome c1 [Alphaproteobacteria bacterium]MBV8548191.1 cytochrome c1 [Alphaproteobacteria bacterium]
MSRSLLSRSVLAALLATAIALPAHASEGVTPPHEPSAGWPQTGAFGTYDRAALQRGFQVYKQVCAVCHSLKLLSYRNLADLGFSEPEIKAIAADYQVTDGPNDQGEMYQRPARPSDHFVGPFPNDQAARAANGGALPPDLSLIIKARHNNENYVYSLLTGFGLTPPPEENIAKGMYYNPYFPGHQIAMPAPLKDDAVTFADGTKATVDQEARDVVQFLAWASEPNMEERKQMGLKAVLFLLAFAAIMYGVKRKVWKDLH